jgi:hypothetical protein
MILQKKGYQVRLYNHCLNCKLLHIQFSSIHYFLVGNLEQHELLTVLLLSGQKVQLIMLFIYE